MSKFFINCDEATLICDKNQYKEAAFWDKVKLTYHLFLCKKCGVYTKQNAIVTKVCDKHLHKNECNHKFSEQEKITLQEDISKEADK